MRWLAKKSKNSWNFLFSLEEEWKEKMLRQEEEKVDLVSQLADLEVNLEKTQLQLKKGKKKTFNFWCKSSLFQLHLNF